MNARHSHRQLHSPAAPAAIGPTLTGWPGPPRRPASTNLSVMDHYLQLGGGTGSAERPMLEGYTTLGYLAAITSTVELQLLVTGVTYRHPGLLAKIVSTLDVLSGGRAMLGDRRRVVRAGAPALGVPFPPLAERFERLEETAADRPPDVERRRRPVRRQALPACRDHQLATAVEPAAPADHGRRRRGEEDPAAGRQVRRRTATCSPDAQAPGRTR